MMRLFELLIGHGLLALSCWQARRWWRQFVRGKRTAGDIVDWVPQAGEYGTEYHPRVRWRLGADEHVFISASSRGKPGPLGPCVVAYVPGMPRGAEIAAPLRQMVGPLVLAAGAFAFLLHGVD